MTASSSILRLTTARGDAALVQTTRDLQRDLARLSVPARAVENPGRPGDRGDTFSLGQLAVDLVTSGSLTALIECVKAYLVRDKSLSIGLRRPDGLYVEMTSHNIDSEAIRADLEVLIPNKK
jgi:hypothetical protein